MYTMATCSIMAVFRVDSNGAFDKLYIDGEFYHGRALA